MPIKPDGFILISESPVTGNIFHIKPISYIKKIFIEIKSCTQRKPPNALKKPLDQKQPAFDQSFLMNIMNHKNVKTRP